MPPQDRQLDESTGKNTRVRQFHTRSKAGCSNCRNRRKRCDEQRPECNNCVKGQRTCIYSPVKIPLRERRAQQKEVKPWDQTPWQVEKTPQSLDTTNKAIIPCRLSFLSHDKAFNRLAIPMPLRSHELFQYLFKSDHALRQNLEMPGVDCLTRLVDDPAALRSAILLAGMHFSFQFGGLASFEPTFLFHKLEIIRLINQWIASRDRRFEAAIIRQIATLAFTEICHGELAAAETHISGILAMVETSPDGQKDPSIPNPCSTDQELTNRYFVLSYSFLCGLKSLLSGISRAGGHAGNIEVFSGKKLIEMSHQWHTSEALQSLALKLKALRLFPFFFSPLPPGAQLKSSDGYAIIQSLRELTFGLDKVFVDRSTESRGVRFDSFWRRGPASRLLEEYVIAHVQSISSNKDKDGNSRTRESSFVGPWCGMVIASVFYMEHVLRALEAVDKRIHKYAITLFQHDVAASLACKAKSRNDEFLLWQVLLGLISSHVYERDECDRGLSSIGQFFQRALRQQAQTLGIKSWPEAKTMLVKVVWPTSCAEDGFMRDLWNDALLTK